MTLLTQCREDAEVVKARQTRRVAISPGEEPIPVFSAAELDAYDRALLRACLRVVAERVREQGNGSVSWDAPARFIQSLASEET